MLIAGVGKRYNHGNGDTAGIPNQWQRYHHRVDEIPVRVGKVAYSVCCNRDDSGNFDYIAGVEVSDFLDLRASSAGCGIRRSAMPCSPIASTSTIRRTVGTIWNEWLPASKLCVADAPNFERYDEKFNSSTGNGGLEISVPVRD